MKARSCRDPRVQVSHISWRKTVAHQSTEDGCNRGARLVSSSLRCRRRLRAQAPVLAWTIRQERALRFQKLPQYGSPLPLTSDSSASVRSVRAATPSHVIRGSLLTHRTLATCGDYQGDPAAVGQAARTPTRAAQPGPWSPPCPPSSHMVRASAPAPRDSALRSAGRATETSPPNRRAR